jgi:mono/diheme cytochrome c family protein
MGSLLKGAGLLPTDVPAPITQPVVAPPAGPNAAYGQYLVAISGCRTCHGRDLAGGTASRGGGSPVGPNLTVIVPPWSEDQFVKTIRTGTDPTGRALRPDMMPYQEFSAAYSADELKAMYHYLHSLMPIQRTAP